jgi:Uma2 family endonuclease
MNDPARTPPRLASMADFLAIPEEQRFHELIAGEIVEKAAPSGEHGTTQLSTGSTLLGAFGRHPPSGGPGGWWLMTEVEIRFEDEICRPDVLGWRRDRVSERPRGTIIEIIPQWTCEVLSKDKRNDLVRKKRIYHRHHVDHYWLLDPDQGTLAVYRSARRRLSRGSQCRARTDGARRALRCDRDRRRDLVRRRARAVTRKMRCSARGVGDASASSPYAVSPSSI